MSQLYAAKVCQLFCNTRYFSSAPLSKTFLDEAADAEHGLEVEGQVEDVQRQQAQQVDVEGGGVGVVLPQLHRLRLQHPVLQITCGQKLCQV